MVRAASAAGIGDALMAAVNVETDLLGVPVAPLKPSEKPRRPVNDMDLIERVLRIFRGWLRSGRRP